MGGAGAMAALPNLSALSFCGGGEASSSNGNPFRKTKLVAQHSRLHDDFATGSHHRDRRYKPIDVDDEIDRRDAFETNLSELRNRRSKANVSIIFHLSTDDDVLAREAVALGEAMSKRLLGYHPNGVFDVDVVTLQRANSLTVDFTEEGVFLFKKAMSASQPNLDEIILRLLTRRAATETRMIFLRVKDARHYKVTIQMPGSRTTEHTIQL